MHETIVGFHLLGRKNTEIAKLVRVSEGTVSKVINDPRAEAIVRRAQERLRKQLHQSIGEKLICLGDVGVMQLEKTIVTDFEAGTNAKKHQDHMTLAVLDRIGYGKQVEIKHSKGTQITKETEDRLLAAIEKANTVLEIDAMPETVAEVIGV